MFRYVFFNSSSLLLSIYIPNTSSCLFQMHKLFDMISGTSTGALVAGGLGIGKMSIAECQDFSWMLSKRAFPTSVLPKIFWSERMDNKLLYELLAEKFGEKTLLDIAHLSPKVMHSRTVNFTFILILCSRNQGLDCRA